MTDVASFLGKPIDDICGNGFDDHGDNHCAHFVSHVLHLTFGMTCKKLTLGSQAAANVRVQEIFPECPEVGNWPPPAGSGPVLIFVTKATNVNLANKTMRNVPKKHIGIFENQVFNYSNTQEKVVSQTVPAFKTAFNAAYGGPQGYFWGTFPSGGVLQAMAPASRRGGKARKTKAKKSTARKTKAKKTKATLRKKARKFKKTRKAK